MAGFQFVSPDIAVDIGTDNTRVYVKDKGIVVNEPSVVITRGEGPRNIVAVGDSAEEMIGRAGGNIRIIHPLRDGVIVDYEMAQIMIHYFVSKAIGTRRFVRPRVVVTMPGDVSKVERRAVISTMEKIGARQIFVVEQAFAAALGTGLPVYEPQGSFVVDIGGGTTEVALVSMGGVVLSHSVRVAGNKIDEAIAGFLKKQHAILVTDRVAEQIKFDLADVRSEKKMEHIAVVRGRDGGCEYGKRQRGHPRTASGNSRRHQMGAGARSAGTLLGYPAKRHLSDGRFGGAAESGYHDRDGIWRTGIRRQRRGRMHDTRRRLYGGSL